VATSLSLAPGTASRSRRGYGESNHEDGEPPSPTRLRSSSGYPLTIAGGIPPLDASNARPSVVDPGSGARSRRAGGPQGPGGERDDREDARAQRAGAIGHRLLGGGRAGVGEDRTGVRPLVEPGGARKEQPQGPCRPGRSRLRPLPVARITAGGSRIPPRTEPGCRWPPARRSAAL
jgi:hypothetical protein